MLKPVLEKPLETLILEEPQREPIEPYVFDKQTASRFEFWLDEKDDAYTRLVVNETEF